MVFHYPENHVGNVDWAMARKVVVITGNCVNTKKCELFRLEDLLSLFWGFEQLYSALTAGVMPTQRHMQTAGF